MSPEEEQRLLQDLQAGRIEPDTLTVVGKFTDNPLGTHHCAQQLKDQCTSLFLSRIRECIEREAAELLQNKDLSYTDAHLIISKKTRDTMASLMAVFTEMQKAQPLQPLSDALGAYSGAEQKLMLALQMTDIALQPHLKNNNKSIENLASEIRTMHTRVVEFQSKQNELTSLLADSKASDEKQEETKPVLSDQKDLRLLANLNKALLKRANIDFQNIINHNQLPEAMLQHELQMLSSRYAKMQDFVRDILLSKNEYNLDSKHSLNRKTASAWLNKRLDNACEMLKEPNVDVTDIFMNLMADVKGATNAIVKDHVEKQNVASKFFGNESRFAKELNKVITGYNEFNSAKETTATKDPSWGRLAAAIATHDRQQDKENKEAAPNKLESPSHASQSMFGANYEAKAGTPKKRVPVPPPLTPSKRLK